MTDAAYAVTDFVTNFQIVDRPIRGRAVRMGEGSLSGILKVSDEPLVSTDYVGSPFSSVVDGLSTDVVGGNMVKILSWYDNEWGFSNRMKDLTRIVAG